MAAMLRILCMLLAFSAVMPAQAGGPLQALLDATPAGGTLRLAPGTYTGPAVIDKPLILEGAGATVDGRGRGTVLTLRANGSTLRGLRLVGSGGSHDQVDAALRVEGEANLIENNVVEDVLFGIVLHRAVDNQIRGNRIRSRPAELADRGDGLRLWYSSHNRIEGNDIQGARDLAVAHSPRNRFIGNRIRNNRYGMQLVFSPRNFLRGNVFDGNATGVAALNSDGITVWANVFQHSTQVSGACLGFKETGAALVIGNEILHCAVGVLSDSPLNPLQRISLLGNRFAHNLTGVVFYGEKGGHVVSDNRFEHNLIHASVMGTGDPLANHWHGNYWDDYQGFDRNGDGVGDTPYELLAYADRIWMDFPAAKFFRSTPVLELLDFLERLAPFVAPDLLLRDLAPRMNPRFPSAYLPEGG